MGKKLKLGSYVVFGISILAASISSIFLILIIGFIFITAIPSLNLAFIFTSESAYGVMESAIGNALAGTILLSTLSVIIAAPIAIATAIYLARFAKDTYLIRIVRLSIEVLSGTPSVVFGMLGFALFVVYFKSYSGGYSLISGAFAMAFLILPVIARVAEESINTVPRELEEGSYALGASEWQTIENITIPVALSGMVTGVILGFGRAAEESAVVVFTVGYSQYYPQIAIKASSTMAGGIQVFPFQNLIGTLPIAVYNAWEFSNVVPLSNGFAAAFVLVMFILMVNVAAKGIVWYTSRESRAGRCKKSLDISGIMAELLPGFLSPLKTNSKQKGHITNEVATSQDNDFISRSDWRLAFTQPIPRSNPPPQKTTAIPVEKTETINKPDKLPDLGRNEENRPAQLPWWKRPGRSDTDTSASGIDKHFDFSSLYTTSGIPKVLANLKSFFSPSRTNASETQQELPLNGNLRADPELFSLILKEQELGELFEDNRDTQTSKDSKTILYTDNDRGAATPAIGETPQQPAVSRSGEEMNPYTFTRYCNKREDFGMFEERPLDLPESNYSTMDTARWRMMHRNREENTFL